MKEEFRVILGGKHSKNNILFEIPTPKMKLYVLNYRCKKNFFDTKEELILYMKKNYIKNGEISIIEYLGNVAGRQDVIKIIKSNKKYNLYIAVGQGAYGLYSNKESNKYGRYMWKLQYGNIEDIYDQFRIRGIIFENDIYQTLANNRKEYLEQRQKIKKI